MAEKLYRKAGRNTGLEKKFSTLLLRWNREMNKRQMPWKGEKDPYRIWLSEIILQQTRVEQGLAYYHNFTVRFPNISQLAKATDEQVFKLWEGLGYYTRCRNLIATARFISNELDGKFPHTYASIRNLKGVGPYTAAAISSFAFNLPHAVVDGNVFRVLARVFGIGIPMDSTMGKKFFTELAGELLDKKAPATYNQAIMDFGAVVCKPVNPACTTCVFRKNCYAYLENKVDQLPVKEKKVRIRTRWFFYLLPELNGKIFIRQRQEKDIWQHLFEFPLLEAESDLDEKMIIRLAEKQGVIKKDRYKLQSLSPVFKQQLSHQLIKGRFLQIKVHSSKDIPGNGQWVKKVQLQDFAFPRIINQYLQKA